MDSSEYELTIKSANQKVDDYVTKCCSNWNVKRLKQHISETHINKPSIEDQRLIYSGNLLKDHEILEEIFSRDPLTNSDLTNSNKKDFTIHLVCWQQKIVNNNGNTYRAISISSEEDDAKRRLDIIEQQRGEPELNQKRTTAELTISINKAPSSSYTFRRDSRTEEDDNNMKNSSLLNKQEPGEIRSHYRTRQIGSYYGQQQQQEQAKTSSSSTSSSSSSSSSSSTSSTSKIAKRSITTNRKQTTSTISEESSLLKTNKGLAAKTAAAIETAASEEQKKSSTATLLSNKMTDTFSSNNNDNSSLISRSLSSSKIVRPSPLEGLLLKDKYKNNDLFDIEPTTTKSIQVEEEEESSIHHRESFSSTTSLKRATGGSVLLDGSKLRKAAAANAAATVSSLSASSSATSEASSSSARHATTVLNSNNNMHQDHHLSTSSSSSSSRHFKTSSSSVQLLSAAAGGGLNTENQLALTTANNNNNGDNNNFLTTDSLFSSPDVRSLVREITTDFAELENALSSTTRSLSNSKLSGSANSSHSGICSLSSRLFGRRLLSPIESENNNYTKAISNSSSGHNLFDEHSTIALPAALKANETTDTTTRYNNNNNRDQDSSFDSRSNTDKINDLLAKAGSFNSSSSSSTLTKSFSSTPTTQLSYYPIKKDNSNSSNLLNSENNHQTIISEIKRPSSLLLTNENKIGVTVSIERIDQKMSDLCKKFNECNDTKEAIDLLKIMIQMIEKAWSVPVCGDDLGFKLCNSLRIAGGLDIILGFIQDADNLPTMTTNDYENQSMIHDDKQSISESPLFTQTSNKATLNNQEAQLLVAKSSTNSSSPLRLNLSKLNRQQSVQSVPNSPTTLANLPSSTSDNNNYSIKASSNSKTRYAIKDSDSDAITSDLGLDSTSVESLSYVSASASASGQVHQSNSIENTEQTNKKDDDETTTTMTPSENKTTTDTDDGNQCDEEKPEDLSGNFDCQEDNNLVEEELAEIKIGESELNEEEVNLRKEELVFLSAKLLSQCLTLDNRDYIVDNGLNPVIKLACNFTTMKSSQSQKLLSRSMIMRQSSSIKSKQTHSKKNSPSEEPTEKITQINDNDNVIQNTNTLNNNNSKTVNSKTLNSSKFKFNNNSNYSQYYNNKNELTENNNNDSDHSVVHAIIGTEILQHLFKHSEDTCSKMISLGALQAILYACRSSNIETLRHCASALANLALYGGPEIQQTMIEEQAHHWLFPLAFNEDDNVQYYACLAIVVLAANQEIEADVQKSGTLDLVEPFVTLHEPQKFAESTTAHIHGQSANWLRKLIPLLESKRQEARSLACFHFAMEAYIKKEQGQTKVFNDIGAVEILKKVGCSPIAIISKFSCQALRLIGEKEPHRLSQHVPKWTCEDVIVWVSQIGFVDKYNDAFLNSHVDGDLLLQLDEDMLRLDIGIENGIIRKKFLRELSKLKQIADYSSVDKSNLSSLLKTNVGNEFVQYIYLMLQLGVTRDNIHWLDIEKLINECKISNTIHQLKLAQAIKDLQEKLAAQVEEDEASELLLDKNGIIGNNCSDYHGHHLQKKTLDVFISYRRSTGSQLASLLKVHLQLRGFSVFIDVERLEAGKFDNNLLDSIKSAKNFILVLSPNALDRCIGDHDCKDWVHKEIVAALASNCNIIPIMDNFHWPDADQLPEDMRSITYFNGVRWIHDYQDACVDKVERFIRGELMNNYFLTNNNNSLTTFNSSAPSSLQRSTATPAIITGAAGVGLSAAPSTATPSTATFPPLTPRIPAPPFDSDHHPLSFASSNHNSYYHNNHHHHHNNNNNHHQQQHYQHSQSAPNTITNMTHSNATHPPVLIRR